MRKAANPKSSKKFKYLPPLQQGGLVVRDVARIGQLMLEDNPETVVYPNMKRHVKKQGDRRFITLMTNVKYQHEGKWMLRCIKRTFTYSTLDTPDDIAYHVEANANLFYNDIHNTLLAVTYNPKYDRIASPEDIKEKVVEEKKEEVVENEFAPYSDDDLVPNLF